MEKRRYCDPTIFPLCVAVLSGYLSTAQTRRLQIRLRILLCPRALIEYSAFQRHKAANLPPLSFPLDEIACSTRRAPRRNAKHAVNAPCKNLAQRNQFEPPRQPHLCDNSLIICLAQAGEY